MSESLETLFERVAGEEIPLPEALAAFYGKLYLPGDRHPLILSNFVASIDGVVSLNQPGHRGAGEISGKNEADRGVMGLLRAASDVVVAGASELRAPPGHIWTPEFIYPPFSEAYQALRWSLGKSSHPLNVIVTASGRLDLSLPLFHSEDLQVLVLTTAAGAVQLEREGSAPANVHIQAMEPVGRLAAREIVAAIEAFQPADTILVEGGPHMTAGFFAENLIDALFLTVAPQVAGRSGENPRLGLAEGQLFAPQDPRWGELASLRRGCDYLFLRYQFAKS